MASADSIRTSLLHAVRGWGGCCAFAWLAFLVIAAPQDSAGQLIPRSLTLSPQAAPATVVSITPHPAIARIVVTEKNGVSFGSGALVDVRENVGLLLTNWHVVRDATGDIIVTFPEGHRAAARVLKTDSDWDLAALSVQKPPRAQPLSLATAPAQIGEPLVIAGYGGGDFRAALGRCTQYLAPGNGFPFEMLEVSVEARQGDSGGPILNQRGEIAGVLFGSSTGATSGSYAGRVRQFLTGVTSLNAPGAAPPAGGTIAAAPPPDAFAAQPSQPAQPSYPPTPQAADESSVQTLSATDPLAADAEGRLFSTPEPRAGSEDEATAPENSGLSRAGEENKGGLIPVPGGDRPRSGFESEPANDRSDDLGDLSPAPRSAGEEEPATDRAPEPRFGRPSAAPSPGMPLPAAEAVRIVHSDLPTRTPPPGAELKSASTDELLAAAWRQIGGESLYDQGKTILALVGLLSLLGRLWSLGAEKESGADAED